MLANRSPCSPRGLSHPESCHFCDQEEETVQHLLTGCLFTRQVWFSILSSLGLGGAAPRHNDLCFVVWWAKVICMISKEYRKGANSLIILTVWLLWKHRNTCVFNGYSPCVSKFFRQFKDDYMLWCLTGAKKHQAFRLDRVGDFG